MICFWHTSQIYINNDICSFKELALAWSSSQACLSYSTAWSWVMPSFSLEWASNQNYRGHTAGMNIILHVRHFSYLKKKLSFHYKTIYLALSKALFCCFLVSGNITSKTWVKNTGDKARLIFTMCSNTWAVLYCTYYFFPLQFAIQSWKLHRVKQFGMALGLTKPATMEHTSTVLTN